METEKFEIKEKFVLVPNLGLIAIASFLLLLHISCEIGKFTGMIVLSVLLITGSALLGLGTLALANLKGTVEADTDGVNIKISLFGIRLSEKRYEYGDIKNMSCNAERHFTKLEKYHEMVLIFIFTDGKKLRFSKRLKIKFNLDRKDPRSYNIAVANEPMKRMYNFVMNQRTTEYYENNPQN
ncbi:MAG: hypothetical protein NC395_05230 [Prevotella sp.]|nr:hypothetical protein [Prevotella sp.]